MTRVLHGRARWAGAALLALLTAGTWFLWTGWALLVPGGLRFEPWQLAGTAVSAAALAILAPRWLPGRLVGAVMPLSFTAVWCLTASATDDTGLWAVGAALVLVGTVAAAVLLVTLGVALRPMRWRALTGS